MTAEMLSDKEIDINDPQMGHLALLWEMCGEAAPTSCTSQRSADRVRG
jgi:hypothetical protein